MNYRGKLLAWLGVIILLLLGVLGYTQGWFEIFGVGFNGTRASVSTQADFDTGTYSQTRYTNGTLELTPSSTGITQ